MKAITIPLAAAALAGSVLPLTGAAPAAADGGGAGAAASFSGYSTTGVATPLKIEVFEPTIPVPTVPQGELDFGYTKVKADSSTSKGRASFLWPGDAVGEGFTTFVQQLGLPEQLGENGYPNQVNSQYPSGEATQEQAPFPGASMTTTSADKTARASVGYSSDCDVTDGPGSGGGDGSGGPGVPQLPGGPGLPGLPPLPGLPLSGLPVIGDVFAQVLPSARTTETSRSSYRSAGATEDPAPACQIPPELAALVDVGGYVADTDSVADDKVLTTVSRAALGEVELVGGLVSLSGITSTTVSASDGKAGTAKGSAEYGTITIAGQSFGIGPDGIIAPGQSTSIPALPDDPNAALATLGITVTVPKPTYTVAGDKAVGTVEGLIVSIDLKTLSPALRNIQLGPILDQLPFPPQMAPVKSALGALGNLSPRFVLHFGYTTATVDTVQAIPIPDDVPDNDPTTEPSEDASGGAAAGGATGGGGGAAALGGGAAPAPGAGPAATTDAATQPLADAALTSGLPKLFSIPGLLLCAGLGGALLAGSYVRRLGALVLGGAGACAHGLDSGLPDLRKVQ